MNQIECKPLVIEDYLFGYLRDKLLNASPDEICAFYIQNLIFNNAEYFKDLIKRYNLPNDILKLHKKIIKIAEQKEGERNA